MKAQFSQKIIGERKAVMAVIAGITQTAVAYTKAPRFAYEAAGCSIDRDGVLTTPVFPIREAAFYTNLTKALAEEGFAAEGALAVAIFPDEYDAAYLGNIVAVLSGKATLIRHALNTQNTPTAELMEGGSAVYSPLKSANNSSNSSVCFLYMHSEPSIFANPAFS